MLESSSLLGVLALIILIVVWLALISSGLAIIVIGLVLLPLLPLLLFVLLILPYLLLIVEVVVVTLGLIDELLAAIFVLPRVRRVLRSRSLAPLIFLQHFSVDFVLLLTLPLFMVDELLDLSVLHAPDLVLFLFFAGRYLGWSRGT